MHKRKTTLLVALMLCAPITAAYADIYQYVDESGVIHFTNVGGGRNYKRVKADRGNPPSREPAVKGRAGRSEPLSSANMPSSYVEIINSACDRHGVDPMLVHAIVKVESDFNPYAMSRKGATGLMQLMPQTAVDLNVKNMFSPSENVDGGVKYLRHLMDRYEGNLSLALAAYNAGETAVKKWGTVPPFKETQEYVRKILRIYNGKGKKYTTRYTIYMSYGEDGALLLTDNPSNYQNRTFRQKAGKTL